MNTIIINADKMVLGRLGSFIAKEVLLGNHVDVINCEKAIITGTLNNIMFKYANKRELGASNQQGPYVTMNPSAIVKRTARGMLSHREGRGRAALKRIRCYSGIPKEFEGKPMIKTDKIIKGVSLARVAELMKST
jgi:ribosomal protein uL13